MKKHEKLQYIRFDADQGITSTLVVQLDGGGAAAEFVIGESAESVIFELRFLANLLEQGVKERQK